MLAGLTPSLPETVFPQGVSAEQMGLEEQLTQSRRPPVRWGRPLQRPGCPPGPSAVHLDGEQTRGTRLHLSHCPEGRSPLGRPRLRMSSAMALWVRFSSFSSFLATSLLRSLEQEREEIEKPRAFVAWPGAPCCALTFISSAALGRPGCRRLCSSGPFPTPLRYGDAYHRPSQGRGLRHSGGWSLGPLLLCPPTRHQRGTCRGQLSVLVHLLPQPSDPTPGASRIPKISLSSLVLQVLQHTPQACCVKLKHRGRSVTRRSTGTRKTALASGTRHSLRATPTAGSPAITHSLSSAGGASRPEETGLPTSVRTETQACCHPLPSLWYPEHEGCPAQTAPSRWLLSPQKGSKGRPLSTAHPQPLLCLTSPCPGLSWHSCACHTCPYLSLGCRPAEAYDMHQTYHPLTACTSLHGQHSPIRFPGCQVGQVLERGDNSSGPRPGLRGVERQGRGRNMQAGKEEVGWEQRQPEKEAAQAGRGSRVLTTSSMTGSGLAASSCSFTFSSTRGRENTGMLGRSCHSSVNPRDPREAPLEDKSGFLG